MIQTFIEKNRRWLLFYYWAARIGGWVFLTISLLAVAGHSLALATRMSNWDELSRYCQHDVPWGMFSNVLPTGLLILGIAQLIWYLLETDHRPRWILSNADKLLYAYTAILVIYYYWAGMTDAINHYGEPHDFPLRFIMMIVFILVKILALVGLAQLLRRLLPMIEESKTLV